MCFTRLLKQIVFKKSGKKKQNVLPLASVCGRRAGTVQRRRRDGGNGVGAQRRCRAADGSRRSCGQSIAARDERADLRSGTGVVEKAYGTTGSPWNAVSRALVTAKIGCSFSPST